MLVNPLLDMFLTVSKIMKFTKLVNSVASFIILRRKTFAFKREDIRRLARLKINQATCLYSSTLFCREKFVGVLTFLI